MAAVRCGPSWNCSARRAPSWDISTAMCGSGCLRSHTLIPVAGSWRRCSQDRHSASRARDHLGVSPPLRASAQLPTVVHIAAERRGDDALDELRQRAVEHAGTGSTRRRQPAQFRQPARYRRRKGYRQRTRRPAAPPRRSRRPPPARGAQLRHRRHVHLAGAVVAGTTGRRAGS